jgi:hypothetical protein
MELRPEYIFDPENKIQAENFDPTKHVIRIWKDKAGTEKKVRILDVSGTRGFFRRIGDFLQHPLQVINQRHRLEKAITELHITKEGPQQDEAKALIARIQDAAKLKDEKAAEAENRVGKWYATIQVPDPEDKRELARCGHSVLFYHPSELNDPVLLRRYLTESSDEVGWVLLHGIDEFLQSRSGSIEEALTDPGVAPITWQDSEMPIAFKNAKDLLAALKQCEDCLPKEMVARLNRFEL